MKNYLLLFLFLLPVIAGCGNRESSRENCISYIDSLKIELPDTSLRVAFIKPELDNAVKSYAFFYNNHLIALNNANRFYAFWADCFDRDTTFEALLNQMEFDKAFVLDHLLYAIAPDNNTYIYNEAEEKWEETTIALPFGSDIPFYEDDKYVCYTVCHGEFGGAVFFYNKSTGQTTFFPSSCARSVMKKDSGYYIVSSLAHMHGSSSVMAIKNPDLLFSYPDSLLIDNGWREMHTEKITRLTDNETRPVWGQFSLDFSGGEALISSGFVFNGQSYFITQMADNTIQLTKLKYDSAGKIIKKESIFDPPGDDHPPVVYRHDELEVIPTPEIIFARLFHPSGQKTEVVNGATIINYQQNTNELSTTIIQRDSSFIRINW